MRPINNILNNNNTILDNTYTYKHVNINNKIKHTTVIFYNQYVSQTFSMFIFVVTLCYLGFV